MTALMYPDEFDLFGPFARYIECRVALATGAPCVNESWTDLVDQFDAAGVYETDASAIALLEGNEPSLVLKFLLNALVEFALQINSSSTLADYTSTLQSCVESMERAHGGYEWSRPPKAELYHKPDDPADWEDASPDDLGDGQRDCIPDEVIEPATRAPRSSQGRHLYLVPPLPRESGGTPG